MACTCSRGSPEWALNRADLVFLGTVIGSETPPSRRGFYHGDSVYTIGGGDMIRWWVVPSRGWKGEPPETLAVYSARSEGACGYEFERGSEYLIYARFTGRDGWPFGDWPNKVVFPVASTSLCDRTAEVHKAGVDLLCLGEPNWIRVSMDCSVKN
jgi:hypothetical protein